MDGWTQIFRTGRHTDAFGDEREWETADLDRIVSSYNPKIHEAPVVIGHPEDNAPAFGWVKDLKREGNILYGRFKNLVPEFVDMVKRGLYKKRSISLYPDLTLRHVGFLGAVPPAIKGLEDVKFQERGKVTICFSDIEWDGGMEMSNPEEKNDQDKELEQRVNDVYINPPRFDKDGRREKEVKIYSEAYEYVKDKDPELARRFSEKLKSIMKLSPEEEKSRAAGEKIVSLVQKKMRADKGLSYSEALSDVQRENRHLILEYLGKE